MTTIAYRSKGPVLKLKIHVGRLNNKINGNVKFIFQRQFFVAVGGIVKQVTLCIQK